MVDRGASQRRLDVGPQPQHARVVDRVTDHATEVGTVRQSCRQLSQPLLGPGNPDHGRASVEERPNRT